MKCHVTILLNRSKIGSQPKLLGALKTAGLVAAEYLQELDMVTGQIEQEKIAKLDSIPGVISVEQPPDFQLPPPDSEIQ